MSDVTRLLETLDREGDSNAAEQLLALVYGELRKLAASMIAQEKSGQTLQPTALVHEAWIRLVGDNLQSHWNGRAHFFGAAAEAMRRILVDRARRKSRIRHGGHLERVDFSRVTLAVEDSPAIVLALNEALDGLAQAFPFKAEIVKLRYFTGMQHGEIARTLGISEATVRRHWAFARAWLHEEIRQKMSIG